MENTVKEVKMWEILVPTERRIVVGKNKFFTTRYHRNWDKKIREISGGLTILTPVKGQWISEDGELFSERMIPVRIIATDEQISKIVDFTLEYYDQLAVLAYQISANVILKSRKCWRQAGVRGLVERRGQGPEADERHRRTGTHPRRGAGRERQVGGGVPREQGKAFNALVGLVMKAAKGKANPAPVNELLKKKLRGY